MLRDHKSFVRRLIDEVFNQKRFGAIATFYASQCDGSSPDGLFHSRDGFSDYLERYAEAFPDFRLQINYMTAEGDRVVVHYTFTGTNTGRLAGFPATGRRLIVPGVMITRLAGERIVEQNFIWDNLGPRQRVWSAMAGEGQLNRQEWQATRSDPERCECPA